ncbi:MAG: hypothetical protein AAF826_08215 [Pseudomonadota bacterium]
MSKSSGIVLQSIRKCLASSHKFRTHGAVMIAVRNIVLMLLVVAGMVLPKMSAVIVTMIPGVMTMVICSGDRTYVVHLDREGNPIETEQVESKPCVLGAVEEIALAPEPAWIRLAQDYAFTFIPILSAGPTFSDLGLYPDLRGPPLVG